MKYKFIGWCKDAAENHDKVWVAIAFGGDTWGGNVLTVWGRRGKKLQTKMVPNDRKLGALINNKEYNKGYKEIDPKRLDEVYPEFKNDLEKTAMWATLKL